MTDKLGMTTDGALTTLDIHSLPEESTYAGVTSFLRRPYQKDLSNMDAAIVGIPFDTATTNRPGARFGPRGIRNASVSLAFGTRVYGWDFHPIRELRICDHGDLPFDFAQPAKVPQQIEEYVSWMLDQDVMVLSLGGDHFITLPVIKAYAGKHGKPISLIHFDAHSDTWPDEHDDGVNHGTMFWHATQQGFLDPATSVQIGLRTDNQDTLGFNILDGPWIQRHGTDAAIEQIRKIVGDNKTYLTFDIDCLDPAYAPGTGTPVCGGLTTSQAREIVKGLAGINIVGADLVEVAPPYDHAEITALAGATLALDFLCLFAKAPWRK